MDKVEVEIIWVLQINWLKLKINLPLVYLQLPYFLPSGL